VASLTPPHAAWARKRRLSCSAFPRSAPPNGRHDLEVLFLQSFFVLGSPAVEQAHRKSAHRRFDRELAAPDFGHPAFAADPLGR